MSMRLRLRSAAALLCLAFAATGVGAQTGSSTPATPAAIKHDAQHLGETVREKSRRFGHEVARGAHQFKDGVKRWWGQMTRSVREG